MPASWHVTDFAWPLQVDAEPVGPGRTRFTYDEDGVRLRITLDEERDALTVELHPSAELPAILRITLYDCPWVEGDEDGILFAWSRLSETAGPGASHAGLRLRVRPLDVDVLTSPPKRFS